MEVLEELLNGNEEEGGNESVYNLFMSYEFDEEDEGDEDYTESPKVKNSGNRDVESVTNGGSEHLNEQDEDEEEEEEDDDDDDDDEFVDDDEDDTTEAGSLADEEEENDVGVNSVARYRKNRQLRLEAEDLIDDWQKVLSEQGSTSHTAQAPDISLQNSETSDFRSRYCQQVAQHAQLLLQQFIWFVKEDGFISRRAASVCCLLGDLLKRRLRADNDRKLIHHLLAAKKQAPQQLPPPPKPEPRKSRVEQLVAEMKAAVTIPDTSVKDDTLRRLISELSETTASNPSSISSTEKGPPVSPHRRTTRSLLSQLPEHEGQSVLHHALLLNMTTLLAEAQSASSSSPAVTQKSPLLDQQISLQGGGGGSLLRPDVLSASVFSSAYAPFCLPPAAGPRTGAPSLGFTSCSTYVNHRMRCIFDTSQNHTLDEKCLPVLIADTGAVGFLPVEDKLLTRAVIKFGPRKWLEAQQHFLPCKEQAAIAQRFEFLTNENAEANPLKRYRQERPLIQKAAKRWTELEDRALIEGVRRFGRRWTKLSRVLPGRTTSELLKRYQKVIKWHQEGVAITYDPPFAKPKAPTPATFTDGQLNGPYAQSLTKVSIPAAKASPTQSPSRVLDYDHCESAEFSEVERDEFSGDDEEDWGVDSPPRRSAPALPAPRRKKRASQELVDTLLNLRSPTKKPASLSPSMPPPSDLCTHSARRECLFAAPTMVNSQKKVTSEVTENSPQLTSETINPPPVSPTVFSPVIQQKSDISKSPSENSLVLSSGPGLSPDTQIESWNGSPTNNDHLLFLACVVEKSMGSPFPGQSSTSQRVTKPKRQRLFSGIEKIKSNDGEVDP